MERGSYTIDKQSVQDVTREAEELKIKGFEGGIVFAIAAFSDAFEVIGAMMGLTVVGLAIWALSVVVGVAVTMGLLAWVMFRDIHGFRIVKMLIRRVIAIVTGFIFEFATGGIFPIRALSVAITIWLNNRFAEERLQGILDALEGASHGRFLGAARNLRGGVRPASENRPRPYEETAPASRFGRFAQPVFSRVSNYALFGETGVGEDRIGSATLNFASAKRREAAALLTPEAAKDPTDRLMKELFYDVGSKGSSRQ